MEQQEKINQLLSELKRAMTFNFAPNGTFYKIRVEDFEKIERKYNGKEN